MEEKTDKVVGYIEYLGAGGMIGEIVPYTSVEKFKDEILDSLDCGRPVTPVVFSDELDEPLQFDSDTYFPWGFRSEKRVQIPYEIYQTNRRDLVFMEYSPARLAAGAKDYEIVYKGQMERWETLDSIWRMSIYPAMYAKSCVLLMLQPTKTRHSASMEKRWNRCSPRT